MSNKNMYRQVLILASAQAIFQTVSVIVMTIGGLAGGSWLAPMITAGAGAAATAGSTGLDLSTIAGDVVGGGVGGAVLTLIVGVVRKMLVGRAP